MDVESWALFDSRWFCISSLKFGLVLSHSHSVWTLLHCELCKHMALQYARGIDLGHTICESALVDILDATDLAVRENEAAKLAVPYLLSFVNQQMLSAVEVCGLVSLNLAGIQM
jgi:hypothetical protein